jgi:F-type H+-transporting ATPase subunit alpha
MTTKANIISKNLKKRLESISFDEVAQNIGTILETGDGAIRISGLSQVSSMEMLDVGGETALALNLEREEVVGIVLGDFTKVSSGDKVKATGKLLSIPVGENLLGRVINPLGDALDGKSRIKTNKSYPIEKIAPGVIYRKSVDTPVQTGIKAIDSMIPIGRGQRELIIGDRQTGKTALVLDTILNQKNENMICIYVAIGQKTSSIALLIDTLSKYGALDYTIVVAANSKDPSAVQYIAPYA